MKAKKTTKSSIIKIMPNQEVIVCDKKGFVTITKADEISRALEMYRRKHKKSLKKKKVNHG